MSPSNRHEVTKQARGQDRRRSYGTRCHQRAAVHDHRQPSAFAVRGPVEHVSGCESSSPSGALTGAATEARELLSPHMRSGLATTAGRPPPTATAAPVAATVSHLAPGRSSDASPRVAGALGIADGGGASCHLTAAAATTSITHASR